MKTNYNLLVITGPTASGKTKLAAHLAYDLNGEIISADSRQVYRGMDIGTGKDLEDYIVKGIHIPYHIIDILEPGEQYNAYKFTQDFTKAFDSITSNSKVPVLCGGTGLYISAVVSGYEFYNGTPDEDLRKELEKKSVQELQTIIKDKGIELNESDFHNKRRLIRRIEAEMTGRVLDSHKVTGINPLVTAINISKEQRRKNIHIRLHQRLKTGMIEEVENLLQKVGKEILISYGLEYKWITLYLTGEIDYNTMTQKLETEINRFAKRQMTWFRGMERKGVKIHWIDYNLSLEEKLKVIESLWYGK